MKIVYLNYNDHPTNWAAGNNLIGGLNTILFNLVNHIAQFSEQKVTVVCRDDGSVTKDNNVWKEINLSAGPRRVLDRTEGEIYLPLFIKACKDYFTYECPDMIHTAGSEAGEAMRQLRLSGLSIPWIHTNYATLSVRRVVMDGQDIMTATNDSIGQREKQILESCDKVVTLSVSDQTEIITVFGVPSDKIDVIEPGIDTTVFYPLINQDRNQTIITAGRMSKIKDFPFLLRSFSILKRNGSKGNLIIIGGNATERNNLGLSNLASELGLDNFLTWVDGVNQFDLANYFRSSKVFVACSRHETFGLLPLEARACGTPFVARANSGYLTTAQDGYGGYFCHSDTEVDLAENIQRILNLPEVDWQVLSQQAIKSIALYNWTETARRSLVLYEKTVKIK